MHAHFDSRYLYAHHILHYFSTQKTKMVAIQPACTLCSSSIIILITAAVAAVVATSGGWNGNFNSVYCSLSMASDVAVCNS